MPDETFYIGYRTRLESKLHHKNTQIARTERLLATLSDEQKPVFEALLKQAIKDRDQIQVELGRLVKTIDGLKPQ
jgi:flagellar motility protein MotE (MotC chaperone)